MKNNKIWYLGYLIGICSLVLAFVLNLNVILDIVFIFIFAISVSISHVKIMHTKMMEKDSDYRISVNDEINEKIRDKVNATMSSILMFLMGVIAVVCISVKMYLPASLLAISLLVSPVIMLFINKYYEKKY
ncbi:DUF2178 domain-containing protein [Gemella sp. GH3]|uniref:DUF2178 domain-containing protein n=1 Tax=unclassified Gemella TaxID=2624949 RepID=UPI0015CFE81C|nr:MULTISPECIES: DUF2178 domain-containing protein [unclassified Gemella]MBF0714055.1 DUF2178 domain-containing protein [Gemella sp. GH3.1]NYS51007.1 DUF2178 domain-containing protein [Gemella sp. GH3]